MEYAFSSVTALSEGKTKHLDAVTRGDLSAMQSTLLLSKMTAPIQNKPDIKRLMQLHQPDPSY